MKRIIAENASFPVELKLRKEDIKFECKYIRWTNKLNDEYSRFYFLNESLELKKTKTTSLNKKGDNYWHSLWIGSDFFNQTTIDEDDENDDNDESDDEDDNDDEDEDDEDEDEEDDDDEDDEDDE